MDKVNIIIPIYNAYEYTIRCIESVICNTNKEDYNLILINDNSDDDRIAEYILKLEEKKIDNIYIYNNNVNLGYVASVNIGMKMNLSNITNSNIKKYYYKFINKKNYSNNDVILLNSDTEVTKNWLNKLKKAAYTNEKIATVTPLTNHGSICSIPNNLKHNELPNNLTLCEYSEIVEKTSLKLYLEIPTAVGFCIYIKRKVLDEIGLFDSEAFGKGYGEENDFCLRAKEKGYIHILCDDTFIYHKGSASFGENQYKHRAISRRILKKKYPYYNDEIQKFISNNSIKPIVDNIQLQLKIRNNNKNILFISHKNILSPYAGGSEYNTKDLITNIKSVNFFCSYVQRNEIHLQVFAENEILEFKFELERPIKKLEFNNINYKNIMEKIINYFNIDCIHVKHFINNTFDIVDIAKEYQIPIFLTLHDYYLICPRINLLDTDNKYCKNTRSKMKCNECLKHTFKINYDLIDSWNEKSYKYLKLFDKVLAPSQSVLENFNDYYKIKLGEFNVNIEVIEHGIPSIFTNNHTRDNIFKVGFLGALGTNKGRNIIYDMISSNKNNDIEWHLFGYSGGRLESIIGNALINHGKYDREKIQSILIDNNIDLICILSIWPETYCHTLSEAIAARIPVLVTDLGALKERVNKYECGWIVDCNSTSNEILNMINAIKDNKYEYFQKINNLNNKHFPSKEEIYDIYTKYYLGVDKKEGIININLNRYIIDNIFNNNYNN